MSSCKAGGRWFEPSLGTKAPGSSGGRAPVLESRLKVGREILVLAVQVRFLPLQPDGNGGTSAIYATGLHQSRRIDQESESRRPSSG